jgi:hypothetical protein
LQRRPYQRHAYGRLYLLPGGLPTKKSGGLAPAREKDFINLITAFDGNIPAYRSSLAGSSGFEALLGGVGPDVLCSTIEYLNLCDLSNLDNY